VETEGGGEVAQLDHASARHELLAQGVVLIVVVVIVLMIVAVLAAPPTRLRDRNACRHAQQ
jgi:hypothetical protein